MSLDKDIWWVRHGESSSNLHENAIEDRYPLKEEEEDFQTMRKNIKVIEDKNYKEPFLNQNIEKGIEILKEKQNTFDNEKSKEYKDLGKMISVWDHKIKNNDSWSTEIEKRGAMNYKPPTSWLFTPILSYAGILHSIEAGKNLYDKITSAEYWKNNFEGGSQFYIPNNDHEKTLIFITSASVRTIMTAIYTLLSYNEKVENKGKGKKIEKIYVMPYINEQTNGAGCCEEPNLDRANTGIPSHLLQKVIKLIAEFVASPNIEGVVLTSKNVIGMIDTGYYMTKADKDKDKYYDKSDLEKFVGVFNTFKTKVVKGNRKKEEEEEEEEEEEDDYTFYNNNRVIAFTHGNFINHKLRKPYLESKGEGVEEKDKKYYKLDVFGPHIFPNNCSVWPFSIEEEGEFKINSSFPYIEEIEDKIVIRKEREDVEEEKGFIPSIAGGGVRSESITSPEVEEEENKKFATLSQGSLCREINDLYINQDILHEVRTGALEQLADKGIEGGVKKGRKTKRRHRRKVTRKIKRKSSGSNKNRKRITRRKRITKRKKYIKS